MLALRLWHTTRVRALRIYFAVDGTPQCVNTLVKLVVGAY